MLDTLAATCQHLPEQSQQTEDERHTVEHVVALVVLQLVGQQRLVAEEVVVDERETGEDIAFLTLAIALYVVLTAYEVPEEVAPVHIVALVGDEELHVVPEAGNGDLLAGIEFRVDIRTAQTAYP